MTRRIHAMDLPEIRSNLIQFLDQDQLANAAAVCSSWNSTFSPEIYREIEWSSASDSTHPSKEAIRTNADYVKTLHLSGCLPADFPSDALTRLSEIHATDSWGYISCDHLIVLLFRNPCLHTVILDFDENTYLRPRDILDGLYYCQNLKHVKLPMVAISRRELKPFLQFCARLESLDVHEISIPRIGPLYKWTHTFPAMKELKFDNGSEENSRSVDIQLEFTRRCPQLQTLHLCLERELDQRYIPKVCHILSTCCPNLKHLSILTFRLPDAELAQVFNSCQNMSSFTIPSVVFDTLAFRAMRRHFGSLTHLDLWTSRNVTSEMVQEAMTSCPLLIWFKADYIYAEDILGPATICTGEDGKTQEIFNPKPWVCLDLKELDVVISGLEDKPAEWHQQVFEQLGRLKELEILKVGRNHGWDMSRTECLDLRLEMGLDKLGSLSHLKEFYFYWTRQQMSEQDIRWMLQAWPHLYAITGRPHFDSKQGKKLVKIINTTGSVKWHDCSGLTDYNKSDDESEEICTTGDEDYVYKDDAIKVGESSVQGSSSTK